MNWLYYTGEANIYLCVFYLAYCLFLSLDTHYQLNRAYLLFSCIISFILPVLQIGALKNVKHTEPVYTSNYATPVLAMSADVQAPKTTITAATPVMEKRYSFEDILWYVYVTGATVLFILLLIKLYTLYNLTRNKQSVKAGRHRLIYLTGTTAAFSFFNFVFIGAQINSDNIIIRHELVHARQKHSADILFLELLKLISWFNPFVYLLQNSLKTVHEYIADEQTAAYETDALTYSSFLVKNAYGAAGSSVTNSFFNYNLLKKRIIMLNQQRSGNLARLKYLLIIPICASLLCASTLGFSKNYGWIDIAPAYLKSASRYTSVFTNNKVKRKRLKVIQNGVTTIIDQLFVNQKNKKVIFTANTITRAERAALLKSHNIKVEVVEDSTRFTTKNGRLILPVVNADGYYLLDHFLHNNIHYNTARGEKGGLVEVGFALDKDRRITNAKIVESGGSKLDDLALNGFNAYKGVVNDDPGKKYKIGVYFFTDNYSIFKTDSLGKDPEFAGELIITNYKYPVTCTNKGYEYDESDIGFPGDDTNMSQAKVVIYDKNGNSNWYYQNKCSPADLEMLKDKYGYTFPSAATFIVKFMYPQNVKSRHLAYIFDVESYLNAPYSGQFYNDMLNSVEYPAQAKKALTGGVVILNFNLDNDGIISKVSVAKSAGNGFDEAAVNALKAYRSPVKDNAGKHSIAVLFCVAENKYRPAVSKKIKKDGYVGELAICDAKSPFANGTAKYTPPAIVPEAHKTSGH